MNSQYATDLFAVKLLNGTEVSGKLRETKIIFIAMVGVYKTVYLREIYQERQKSHLYAYNVDG